MSHPERLTLSAEEGEAIIARLSVYAPSRADCELLIQVLRLYVGLVLTVQEATLSIRRLRNRLFGSRRPSQEPPASATSSPLREALGQEEDGDEAASVAEAPPAGEAVGCATGSEASQDEAVPTPTGGHRAGTGRLGAEASSGAERIACRQEDLAVGQRCPVCGQGTFYELPPGGEMRIDGHALRSALRYELHKRRCAACGQMFTASLPAEAGQETYRARARAVLVVGRYSLGLPCYRLQGDQAMLGVPIPDATQWDQIEKVGDCGSVVFASLET